MPLPFRSRSFMRSLARSKIRSSNRCSSGRFDCDATVVEPAAAPAAPLPPGLSNPGTRASWFCVLNDCALTGEFEAPVVDVLLDEPLDELLRAGSTTAIT